MHTTKLASGLISRLLRGSLKAPPKLVSAGPRAVPPVSPFSVASKPPPLPRPVGVSTGAASGFPAHPPAAAPGSPAAAPGVIRPAALPAPAAAAPNLSARLSGAGSTAAKLVYPALGATALGGAVLQATQTARGMFDHASGYATGRLEGAGDSLAMAGDYLRKMPFLQRFALAMAPDTALSSKQVHRMLTEKMMNSPDWKTRWFGPMVAGRAIQGLDTLRSGGSIDTLPRMSSYLDDTARMYDAQLSNKVMGYLKQLGYNPDAPATGAAASTAPTPP